MKLCLMLSTFILCSSVCKGQHSGSLSGKPDEHSDPLYYKDQVDSLATFFFQQVDTLRAKYRNRTLAFDSAKTSVTEKLKLNTATQRTTGKLNAAKDSIDNLIAETTLKINYALDSLKKSLNSQLDGLQLPEELNSQVENFSSKISELDIKSNPALNLPGNINIPAPVDLKGAMSTRDLTGSVGSLNIDDKSLSQVGHVTDLTNKDMESLTSEAESKLADVSGVQKITAQADIKEYDNIIAAAKDPEAAREEAIDKIQQEAYDHFSGHQKEIEQAMDAIGKYKKKFSSLPDVKNAPRHVPNAMKGKPLIERLVPSFAVQIQKNEKVYTGHFNPAIAYRISGRLNAGLGWNVRLGYDTKSRNFISSSMIHGPRAFTEFNAWKAFYPRLEVESMRTPIALTTTDRSHVEWVTGVYAGVKKEYTLVKTVKGSILLMALVYNAGEKIPTQQRVNLRIGVEVPLKKKQRK